VQFHSGISLDGDPAFIKRLVQVMPPPARFNARQHAPPARSGTNHLQRKRAGPRILCLDPRFCRLPDLLKAVLPGACWSRRALGLQSPFARQPLLLEEVVGGRAPIPLKIQRDLLPGLLVAVQCL
jgi:hypothetical protein